jgi:hypothetical protein
MTPKKPTEKAFLHQLRQRKANLEENPYYL